MSRLLVTGADGFVGRHLVRAALLAGHEVTTAIAPNGVPAEQWLDGDVARYRGSILADLCEPTQIGRLAECEVDAVVHLAAVSSGSDARRDPRTAWLVNTVGTALLAEALAAVDASPRLLLISTGEVYGSSHRGPIAESADPAPCSPYAASKLAAEVAAMEVSRRRGLDLVVARPFPHTGPGQDERFVLPAFARRLSEAAVQGDAEVSVGDLSPVRDFLDVRDVVQAYLALLERGESGSVYNVASGAGQRLSDCFALLSDLTGSSAQPAEDASLLRPADIPSLIGDSASLRATTEWKPQLTFTQTLQDLVDAQAD
jgi:GDP-4-dehydro-6-deoxy-D-mannose reductase